MLSLGTSRQQDFTRADEVAGFKPGERPKDYTWHHTEREGEMELIPTDLHDEVRHTGGWSIWGGGQKEIEVDPTIAL